MLSDGPPETYPRFKLPKPQFVCNLGPAMPQEAGMSETIHLNICPKCGATIPAEAPQGLCPKCVLAGAAHPTEAGVAATATGEIPTITRIAAAFPQLEVLELIGRGGMGFVFKARQPHLDRYVALKLLPDKLASDPHFAERFNREGRFLAKLSHPNIVSVFDFGQAGGFYFLLMEYVDGVNLRQAMRAGRFSPAEALGIVPKICEALQYAHEQGVLHRDIKPENILLDAKGRVKIADFGIAKLVGEDAHPFGLTGTGAALGTPHYMAPEQLEKPGDVDHRADIYSLGVVFYEMLTGELPIGRFAPPSARTPLDERVDEIVMRALERERELRQKNVGEIKTQVERVTSEPRPSEPASKASQPAALPLPAWSQKAIWGAVLVGISFLPVILLGFVAYFAASHRGGIGGWEIVIAAVTLFLPAIAGTILGWMGLSDIRAHAGKLRGLPLATFAALAWPLLILLGVTLVVPTFITYRAVGPGPLPMVARLMLLVPVGAITFAIWAVYAAVRWGGNKPPSERRGVLKWVYLALLLFGVALTFLPRPVRQMTGAQPQPILHTEPATPVTPWIRFTFTAVELREVQGVRWLAIDYLDDVHGECQKAFPWEATIPNFKAETRTTEFFKESKDSSPAVRHQRVEYRLPDSVSRPEAEVFAQNVGIDLRQKSFRLELGEEKLLFDFYPEQGGSLKARIKVTPPLTETPLPDRLAQQPARSAASGSVENVTEYQAVSARLDTLRSRESELLTKYTDQHPFVARIRKEIADNEEKKKALEISGDDLYAIQIRLARDQLAETRKRFDIGLTGDQEVAKAERNLAVAEARDDAVAIAKANLKFAESALMTARKRLESGLLSATEVRQAEGQRAAAAVELQRALRRIPPRQLMNSNDQAAYAELTAVVASLREKVQQLSQQYTAENPLVQRAVQQLREAEIKLKALEKRPQ